jgi:hypothetical protein
MNAEAISYSHASPLFTLRVSTDGRIVSTAGRAPSTTISTPGTAVQIFGWPIADDSEMSFDEGLAVLGDVLPRNLEALFAFHGPFFAAWESDDGTHLVSSPATPGVFIKREQDAGFSVYSCDAGMRAAAGSNPNLDALGLWLLGNINVDPFRTLSEDVIRSPGMCQTVFKRNGGVSLSAIRIPRVAPLDESAFFGAIEATAASIDVIAREADFPSTIFLVSSGIDGLVPALAYAKATEKIPHIVSSVTGYNANLKVALERELMRFLSSAPSGSFWENATQELRNGNPKGDPLLPFSLARQGAKSNVLLPNYKLVNVRRRLHDDDITGIIVNGYGIDESLLWKRPFGSAYSSVYSATFAGAIDFALSRLWFLLRFAAALFRPSSTTAYLFDSEKMHAGLSWTERQWHREIRRRQINLAYLSVIAGIDWSKGSLAVTCDLRVSRWQLIADRQLRATIRYLIANSAHQFRFGTLFSSEGRLSYQPWDSGPMLVAFANRRRTIDAIPKSVLFRYARRVGFPYGAITRNAIRESRGHRTLDGMVPATLVIPRSVLRFGLKVFKRFQHLAGQLRSSSTPVQSWEWSPRDELGGAVASPLNSAMQWAHRRRTQSRYHERIATALEMANRRGSPKGHLELNALQLAMILGDEGGTTGSRESEQT